MISVDCDGIRYYQFEIFTGKVIQAFFTRRGGVSPKPWSSLNLGGTVGDEQWRVVENQRRALDIIGRKPSSVFDVWQVHSIDVAKALTPRNSDKPHLKADAIVTDSPGITLMMRFADCVPVYLFDPIHKVIGIAHAGWQGTIKGMIPATINAMHLEYGSRPIDILAGIGPSIGPDHYQIGEDVAAHVHSAFGQDSSGVLNIKDETIFFNLWAANQLQLERCGVREIEISNVCTACHLDDWFSHRAENGKTGRFGAILGLK